MPLDRPIPAFYCCYLLRSTVRRASVYVGSTTHPARRLRQHNGEAKGGAARTNRPNLRPWEMTCIVTGFPSRIAALQFEWAWQNPHVTLHIPPGLRIQHSTETTQKGHPKRPRHSLPSLLSNLQLLLRVPSFSRWPLELRFFTEDAYRAWLEGIKTVAEPLRDSLNIIKDFPPRGPVLSSDEVGRSPKAKKRTIGYGVSSLDIGYGRHKEYVEKGKTIIEFEQEGSCSVCHSDLEHDGGFYAICPSPGCESVAHVTCLSKHFLKGDKDAIVPIHGYCPNCKSELHWVDVVKELALRTRGQREVEKLLKAKRARKGKGPATASQVSESEDNSSEEEEHEMGLLDDLNSGKSNMNNGDSWYEIDDSEDSDAISTVSHNSPAKKAASYRVNKTDGLKTLIEDSDWDEAEILD